MAEMEDLTDPALYDTDPEKAWKRLKPKKFSAKYLSAFVATAVWRERTAQERDQPRGRILKDEAIDELATQAPTSLDGLNTLRSVPKGFGGSKFGPDLLAAIKAALADPEGYAPVLEKAGPPPPASAGGGVVLLKVLL
jgi:ribonuclease D